MRICNNCGMTCDDSTTFCPNCGAPTQEVQQQMPSYQQAPMYQQQAQGYQSAGGYQQPQGYQQPGMGYQQPGAGYPYQKSYTKIIVGILVALFLFFVVKPFGIGFKSNPYEGTEWEQRTPDSSYVGGYMILTLKLQKDGKMMMTNGLKRVYGTYSTSGRHYLTMTMEGETVQATVQGDIMTISDGYDEQIMYKK